MSPVGIALRCGKISVNLWEDNVLITSADPEQLMLSTLHVCSADMIADEVPVW